MLDAVLKAGCRVKNACIKRLYYRVIDDGQRVLGLLPERELQV